MKLRSWLQFPRGLPALVAFTLFLAVSSGCGTAGTGRLDARADADVPAEDVKDEEATDTEVPGEDVRDEEATDTEVPGEDVRDEVATDTEVPGEDVRDEVATDTEVPGEDVRDEEATDTEVPGEDVRDEVAPDADVPGEDVQDEEAVSPQGRLVAVSREGQVASLDLAEPWTVRASANLGVRVESARCLGALCVVVHPSPGDAIAIIDALDLSVTATIPLERGADPRDVAIVDDRTVVVSQHNRTSLVVVDPVTRTATPIDLGALADADGLPEAHRLASCGRKVYAQLRRVDHDTGAPTALPAVLAVIDLDRPDSERLVDVDPNTPGLQGITLAGRPDFDMPIDCAAGVLYVAEPMPLMQGGGGYEKVDLRTLTAADFAIDTGAEVGGFEIVDADRYWLITHTEFGPGPSSHLNLFGGEVADTHNTFASEHVDDLALDRVLGLLYFPDPCTPETWAACDGGIQVFHALSGVRASARAVKLDFAPIEVAVAR